MQLLNINELTPHSKNSYYFDDMSDQKWKEFLKSVKTSGIIEPIICNQNKVIISGHQRYRACIELGIDKVLCDIRSYKDEKQEIKDLIETNIRQRGDISSSSLKMSRIIKTLEEIYGVTHGGSRGKNYPLNTQEQIAKELGISVSMIKKLKQLQTLSPELQQLIEDGSIKYTTALNVCSKLSNNEQEKLINEIGKDKIKEMTSKQIQQYILEKQQIEDKNKQLEQSFNELSKKYSNLESQSTEQKEIVKEKIVDNTDYNKINKLKDELKRVTTEKENIKTRLDLMEEKADAFEQDSIEYQKIKDDITYLTNQKDELGRKIQSITDISGLVVEIDYLIKNKLAPVRYSRSLLEAKDDEIVLNNLTEIVQTVEQWCLEMRKYIPKKENYVEVIE